MTKTMIKNRWVLPLLAFLLIAPFTPQIDLYFALLFYQQGMKSGDFFVSHPFLTFIYNYGVIPAQVVAIGSVIFFIFSYLFRFFKRWRTQALLCLLTMVIGAGFITHTLFKDHWGRPRPKQ